MTAFAIVAAVVFGAVAKDTTRDRLLYGLKVFVEFLVIGLILGWIHIKVVDSLLSFQMRQETTL